MQRRLELEGLHYKYADLCKSKLGNDYILFPAARVEQNDEDVWCDISRY